VSKAPAVYFYQRYLNNAAINSQPVSLTPVAHLICKNFDNFPKIRNGVTGIISGLMEDDSGRIKNCSKKSRDAVSFVCLLPTLKNV